MTAGQLIATIRAGGGSIRLVDGRVRLGNLETLPAGTLESARAQKLAIAGILCQEQKNAGRAALKTLDQAGGRLPRLPGDDRRVVAVPRAAWSSTVADALGQLGYSGLPVVLLNHRYDSGDPSIDEEAGEKVRAGEYFEKASAVDPTPVSKLSTRLGTRGTDGMSQQHRWPRV